MQTFPATRGGHGGPAPTKNFMNQQTASQALWRIAETDDTREVESILASGAEIDASNAGGMTALMRAAAKGRKRMVLALLDHGADPNRARNDKFTALMLAAFFWPSGNCEDARGTRSTH